MHVSVASFSLRGGGAPTLDPTPFSDRAWNRPWRPIAQCGKVYRPIVISIYCMTIELPSGSTVKHDKILTPDEK